ncbi:MAG: DUF4058 family protein [Anaerolineae bacterium]
MAFPFPGMDPYLEAPDIWPDFHDRLATVISADLNTTLPEPYYARLEMRPELGVVLGEGVPRRIVPDVVVVRRPEGVAVTAPVLDRPRTEISEAVHLTIRTDPIRHHFVEIRDAVRGHKLVTLIEIVSPSNKGPGPDRRAYEEKQREVLNSDASLIELDLLRTGDRILPYAELGEAVEQLNPDYLILINRAAGRRGMVTDYELYPVALAEPFPCIPVPLRAGEQDVPLDLQVMVNRAYDGGPYRRMIDYTQPPDPPLSDREAAWANALLRDAGLR